MIILLIPVVIIGLILGPFISPLICLAMCLLILAGVLWSPIAALLSFAQQNHKGSDGVYYALYAAFISTLFLLPWVYYFLRNAERAPSAQTVEKFYRVLYAGWILGPFSLITLIGVVFTAFLFFDSAQILINRDAWITIAKWLALLLTSTLLSALCGYTWFISRRELLAYADKMEKANAAYAGDTLGYPYLRPFMYCTAWAVVTAIGIPLALFLQLAFSFEY